MLVIQRSRELLIQGVGCVVVWSGRAGAAWLTSGRLINVVPADEENGGDEARLE